MRTDELDDQLAEHSEELLTAPGSLVREGDLVADAATLVDSASLGAIKGKGGNRRRFATATKNSAGGLTVTLWSLSDAGTPTIVDTATDSTTIDRLAITNVGGLAMAEDGITDAPARFVVGTRTTAGSMQLTSWSVNGDDLVKVNTETHGEIQELAITQVPMADPLQPHVTVAVKNATNNRLKVLSYGVDNATGALSLKDADEVAIDVSKVSVAAAPSPAGVVVTPALQADGQLRIVRWLTSASGALTKKSELVIANSYSEVSATTLSYRRIAIAAVQTVASNLKQTVLRTVDLTGDTGITVRSSGISCQNCSGIDVANGGGSRLFVTGKDNAADGYMRLDSWDAIDDLRQLDSVLGGGTVHMGALSVLRGSRVITSVLPTSNGKLKPIAWQDYNTPLVRSTWPLTTGVPINPEPVVPPESKTTFSFVPGGNYHADQTIGIGEKFVVLGGNNKVWFYDKAGNKLAPKHVGAVTELSLSAMFAPFRSSSDEQSLLRHLEHSYSCDPEIDTPSESVSLCPDTFYDSRVTYDPGRKRFVIATHMGKTGDELTNLVVFAVSKSEDPRDGFHLFGTPDPVLRDNPRIGVSGQALVVAYNGEGDPELRPNAFIYDMDSLADNVAEPLMTKIFGNQIGLSSVPVNHYGSHAVGLLVHQKKNTDTDVDLTVHGFKPLTARGKLALISDMVTIDHVFAGANGTSDPAVRLKQNASNVNLHEGPLLMVDERNIAGSTVERDIVYKNIDLRYDSATHALDITGQRHHDIACPDRSGSTPVSCERMSIASDEAGRVFIGFERASKLSDSSIPNEARYLLFSSTSNDTPIKSNVLKAGTFWADGPNLQFSTSVPDPFSDGGFWMVHEYGVSGGDGTDYVAGRVMP